MIISKALFNVRKVLGNQSEAEILLAFLLKKPREYVFSHPEFEFLSQLAEEFMHLCQKRASGAPIAYLTRRKEFFSLDFYVDERVFIPRPETELLVEETLNIFNTKYPLLTTHYPLPISILDLGTGSGCVAVALAKNLPNVKIVAVDISEEALEVARKNAESHGVSNRIEFIKSDLLSAVMDSKFEGVVANLPYIGASEHRLVSKEVMDHEPREALFGGETGLELFEKLFIQLNAMRRKPKRLIAEIGFSQKDALSAMLRKYFGNAEVMWKNDLAGLPRAFILGETKVSPTSSPRCARTRPPSFCSLGLAEPDPRLSRGGRSLHSYVRKT